MDRKVNGTKYNFIVYNRPISLLPILSKTLEIILPANQFRFRRNDPSIQRCHRIVIPMSKTFEAKQYR